MFGTNLSRWIKLAPMLAIILGVCFAGAAYPAPAVAQEIQTSDVFWFPENPGDPPEQVDGAWSKLLRSKNSVAVKIRTKGLDAGAAYTLWWVVFNDPGECEGGCDGADIDLCLEEDNCTEKGISVLWATGQVVGADGAGKFVAAMKVNRPKGEVLFGPGLLTSEAEIHVVMRTHGLPIPGKLEEQLTTFAGGCDVRECADHQFAVHLP